jgi:hypothetical protein
VLDQDAREVKILKEIFFEDEETDGLGRSRQFRWKHLDANGVAIEGQEGAENEGENGTQGGSDDENEELWRKMRHERELFKEKNKGNVLVRVTLNYVKSCSPANLNASRKPLI